MGVCAQHSPLVFDCIHWAVILSAERDDKLHISLGQASILFCICIGGVSKMDERSRKITTGSGSLIITDFSFFQVLDTIIRNGHVFTAQA